MRLIVKLIALSLLPLSGISAQNLSRSSLGMAGSSQELHYKNRPIFISQSIGQSSVTGTFFRNDHVLRQGFQQPIYSVSASGSQHEKLEAILYPNPTRSVININVKDASSRLLHAVLSDNSGRIILNKKYTVNSNIKLSLDGVDSGAYILKINSGNKLFVAKVIKE